jgi:hypothetical protein
MTNSQREEIQTLRAQYQPQEPTKMDELKKLHKKVQVPAQVFAYTFGSLSSLVFGAGMCLAMKVIGNLMPLGIVVGLAGLALMSLTYPAYKAILKSRKNKYQDKILQLSSELLKD